MSGPPIVPFDWQRIWLGDVPPLFLLEIVFRTVVIFLWLLLLLRVTGKRSLAQLSGLDLAIVIALGSAAGDPLFYPEVPLLHAMLALALVVALQRGLSWLVVRSERVETLMEGQPVELVRDGVFSLRALETANLSREDLFEKLRAQGAAQLGEVRRAYFEQDGNLTVFSHDGDPPPGLPVVPPWDLEKPAVLDPDVPHQGFVACLNCGRVERVSGLLGGCECGGKDGWTVAVTDPLAGPAGV
ncbi:DUF421 domain-containing protein [Deinococcus frigens]|uniref:DUF421 domain-containing protein n=1 Tax=Deinococcus frigens TaxID=249403 RepID=UPI0004966B5F|nr:YetF domain-containing protein [Deinococcus frigens]